MDTRFDCPHCGKTLLAPEKKAGSRLSCPKCDQSVTVPPPLPRKGEVFTDEPAAPPKRRGRKLGTLAWVGIAVGGVLVLTVVIGAGLGLFVKKGPGGENNQAAAKTDPLGDAQGGSKQPGGDTTERKTPTQKDPDSAPLPTTKKEPGADAQAREWVPLFNGKDLAGWRIEGGDTTSWRVDAGDLVMTGKGATGQGWLLTDRDYSDFLLRFEYQAGAGANTGVTFRHRSGEKFLKVNLLNDASRPEALAKLDQKTGGLWWPGGGAGRAPDQPARLEPEGTWNRVELQVQGRSVRVKVNDREVLNANLDALPASAANTSAVKNSSGRIGFQQHTGTARFRNVEVKGLSPSQPVGANLTVLVKTSLGDIRLELFKDKAPRTVENFLAYVDEGFYDGTIFHRVVPNFTVQGGGFEPGLREKKPTRPPVPSESDNGLTNAAGTVAMARAGGADSATTQFFINLNDNSRLLDRGHAKDGVGYCVFGKVVGGMDVVDQIKAVRTTSRNGQSNVPVEDVRIISIRRE
jgi:cyclophilin family peptidyl-prolyl cis-trans isomerase